MILVSITFNVLTAFPVEILHWNDIVSCIHGSDRRIWFGNRKWVMKFRRMTRKWCAECWFHPAKPKTSWSPYHTCFALSFLDSYPRYDRETPDCEYRWMEWTRNFRAVRSTMKILSEKRSTEKSLQKEQRNTETEVKLERHRLKSAPDLKPKNFKASTLFGRRICCGIGVSLGLGPISSRFDSNKMSLLAEIDRKFKTWECKRSQVRQEHGTPPWIIHLWSSNQAAAPDESVGLWILKDAVEFGIKSNLVRKVTRKMGDRKKRSAENTEKRKVQSTQSFILVLLHSRLPPRGFLTRAVVAGHFWRQFL